MNSRLALFGGEPTVTVSQPHEIWPPPATQDELSELATQRNSDISIRGRTGPILEFEELFLAFLGGEREYAVSFNSGTSALLAAYVGIGIRPGDEVIGPALTYHAALSPLFALGASPVLVDIDRGTRCIDPSAIDQAITPRTKAITVVHQWGHPADMDEIVAIARRHDLKIVEDCSHAHASKYKGVTCGTIGDVAAFSLQTNKAMFAGEGGILVTNDPDIHARATLLGHYRDRSRAEIAEPRFQKLWVTGFGLKLRMSPFNAIVAKHSLRHFASRMVGRHRCLEYFRRRLAEEVDYVEAPHVAEYAEMGAWYGFKPLLRPEKLGGLERAPIVSALRAERVEVSAPSGSVLSKEPIYSTDSSPIYPSMAKHANSPSSTPNACYVDEWGLSLPTFWNWDTDKAIIDQYIDAFNKVGSRLDELKELATPA